MSISDLPLELIFRIADYLDFEKDINALARYNKRCYSALNSYLYRHHVKQWDAAAFESVCKSGFTNSMRMFLDDGMSLETCCHGWNPIALAAIYGHEDIMKYLLGKGVDPNAERFCMESSDIRRITGATNTWGGRGPFDYAVRFGQEGIVRLLVPHRRSVDYFLESYDDKLEEWSYGKKTPLTVAAESGHLSLVIMLVEELKCNVDPTRSQEAGKITWTGMSPLARAALNGHNDIVRYLLSVGADPNAATGETFCKVLGYAVEHNHLETAKTLIEHGANPDPSIEIQQAKGTIWHEDNEYGYDYEQAYEDIMYPLIGAARHGYREMVKLMFQYIDLDRMLKGGAEDANILVPIAAACGLECIVQRLLEGGCGVNAYFTLKRGPCFHQNTGDGLSFASRIGHIGVAQILLDHGADPNAPEVLTHFFKPLNAAVGAGHQRMVEFLLDAGAETNTIDCMGFRIPMLMSASHSEPIFKMFLDRGADPSTLKLPMRKRLLQNVLISQNVSTLRTLLETKGLSILKVDGSFQYLMEVTAEAGSAMFECTMQCLWRQHHVKPNPQRRYSYSALEAAIRRHHAEVVEIFLLRYGLKLESNNVVDYLRLAAAYYGDDLDRSKAASTLDVLLRHGADINARRDDGHTCLGLFVRRGYYIELGAKLLIERGAKCSLTYADLRDKCLPAAMKNTTNPESSVNF